MFKQMIALTTLVLAATLIGCAPKSGSLVLDDPTPVAIESRLTGEQSGIMAPTVQVINSTSELQALGSPALSAANIDFANNSLIVLALGEQTSGGYWAKITSVQRMGNIVVVHGVANAPAADAVTTSVMTTPFDAVVVPALGPVTLQTEIASVTGMAAE